MQHVLDLGWDVILFNRKLMAYKPAWVFRGQEFFDKEHKLPVSKGWEFNSTREKPIHLTLFHADKAKELKLSWKEYTEKILVNKACTLHPIGVFLLGCLCFSEDTLPIFLPKIKLQAT